MAYALISDIHANLEALKTVLRDIQNTQGVKHIVCLGDIVGYGPFPKECLDMVRKNCDNVIAGNHDIAAHGYNDLAMADTAQQSMNWTRKQLSRKDKTCLRGLDLQLGFDLFVAAHGRPMPEKRPENVERLMKKYFPEEKSGEMSRRCYKNVADTERINSYIFHGEGAQLPMETHEMAETLCFVQAMQAERPELYVAAFGHTHTPYIYRKGLIVRNAQKNGVNVKLILCYPNIENTPLLLNVPSVGQPRDGDPRTGYALIRRSEVRIVRLPYDMNATVKALEQKKCPKQELLSNFLRHGTNVRKKSE